MLLLLLLVGAAELAAGAMPVEDGIGRLREETPLCRATILNTSPAACSMIATIVAVVVLKWIVDVR